MTSTIIFEVNIPIDMIGKSPDIYKMALVNEFNIGVDRVMESLYDGVVVPKNIRINKVFVNRLQDFVIKNDISLKQLTSTLLNNFFGG